MESEIKKCKTGGCGESVVIDVPLSELFHKELARRSSEDNELMMMRIIWILVMI